MTNPTIDPISYNAGIEAAAKWHDEQERLFRMRALSHLEAPLPAPEVHDAQDQVADLHRDAAKSLRSLHRTEPQTAPTCICPRCSATIVGEMNGPEDEPVTADAERLALAERIEKHVNVMANTSMHLSLEQWGDIANDLLTASAALRAGGWREDMPPVSVGCEREFIVAVYRASSGKAYTFAASYLNAYPLQYEHECPKWKEGVGCSGEGCDDGCPTTGWFEQTGDDDYSSLYNRLELREGDVFLGWSELPKWNGPPPSAPAHR